MKSHLLLIAAVILAFASMAFIAAEQSKPAKSVKWIDLPENIGQAKPGDSLSVFLNDTVFEVNFYKGEGKIMIVK